MMAAPQTQSSLMETDNPLRVFVVEDSPRIRETLIQEIEEVPNLKVIGFAESAGAAIEQLDRQPCDVVIIDLQLRQGTGFDVLSHLKKVNTRSNVTRIVLTNYASDLFKRRALQVGADYFFDKSMEHSSVLAVLRDLAGSSHLH